MEKYFYERNEFLLTHKINKTFEEILWMNEKDFRNWCIELREIIVYAWDNLGLPPIVGKTEKEIINMMNEMINYPVNEFLAKDEITGDKNVIRNTKTGLSGVCNAWFPTMMKTKINYTKGDGKTAVWGQRLQGKSIYDYFASPAILDTFVLYSTRHFRRDSFYHYSNPVKVFDKTKFGEYPVSQDAIDWIKDFEANYRHRKEWDYWLAPKELDKEYSGYNDHLRNQQYLNISKENIIKLGDLIPNKCMTNVDWEKSENYQIRAFTYGQKLFPLGFKAFRVSYCQYAVNFPPLTAKFLYERFTDAIKDQPVINIYDPSAGWGGRILGAMAVNDNRNIHYIGTDPNMDHTITPGYTKYHAVADFFNNRTYKANGLFPKEHTYEIFQEGSEVIKDNPKFQKYKGKLDLVFTSPPYFNREGYSEDPGQSCIKFSDYESWRDGFLRPTLQTCVEWLRNERYLLWNIADLKVGQEYLPLEQDSRKFLEEFGMQFKGVLKMALASMPGANRTTDDGEGTAKNFVKIDGMILKYEPVWIYYKP